VDGCFGGNGSVTGAQPAYGAAGGGGNGYGPASWICGVVGAVRIIWPGTTRSFPSTCTADK
jgi:hypothetical protein